MLLVTWLVWMAASLHLVAYGVPLIVGVSSCSRGGPVVTLRLRSSGVRASDQRPSRRLLRRALRLDDPVRRRRFWNAEAVFAVCYALGCPAGPLRARRPEHPASDGHGLHHGHRHSRTSRRTTWMSGETLNYYYLGHMVLAWPIELLGLRAGHRLSAGLGRAAGLTATAVYTFAGTLWAAARETLASARRAAGRCSPGSWPPRWWRSSATSPACAPGSRAETRRATTPGSSRRG